METRSRSKMITNDKHWSKIHMLSSLSSSHQSHSMQINLHHLNFFKRFPFIYSHFGNRSCKKTPRRITNPLRNCSTLTSTALLPSTTIPGFHKTTLQKFISHKSYSPMGNEHQCLYAPFIQSKDSLFFHMV